MMEAIKEDARKRKITNKEIAKALAISSGQVTHYFKLTNRIPFYKFIELVRLIYSDTNKIEHLLVKFVETNTKRESIREAAEWFSNNGKLKLLQLLLKLRSKDDPLLGIYEILILRNQRMIKAQELYIKLDALRDQSFDFPEWRAFTRIAKLYAYLDLKSYSIIPFLAEEAMVHIKDIGNSYIKNSFRIRVIEVQAIAEMKRNNVDVSEALAKEVIENGKDSPLPANSMYSLLAELYVFRSFDKSLMYINKALQQFNGLMLQGYANRQAMLEATHDFIRIHHNAAEPLYLTDHAEKAHALIKSEDVHARKQGLEILDEIERVNRKLSPHQLYYKALYTRKNKDAEEALNQFIINGDLFYSYLPRELMKEFS